MNGMRGRIISIHRSFFTAYQISILQDNGRRCGKLMFSRVILWVGLINKETFFKKQNDILAIPDEFRHVMVMQRYFCRIIRYVLPITIYHPWRVYYVNGEFRAYGIEGNLIDYSRRIINQIVTLSFKTILFSINPLAVLRNS